MNSELPHIPYLDGWRGIAIILVLVGHAFGVSGSRLGVEVFFVLSGMLMCRVLFDAKVTLATFYWRRAIRILPTFFLFLLTMMVLAATVLPPFTPWQFLYNAVFLARYMPADTPLSVLPIEHLWSLNVEEHSYVFLSVIAALSRKPRIVRLALTAAAVACIVNFASFGEDSKISIFRSECAAFPLIASAALHLWLREVRFSPMLLLVSSAAFVASLFASRMLGGSIGLDYIAKPFCVAVMLNSLDAGPAWVLRALSARWLCWLGVCSFSLYLWHPPIMEFAKRAGLSSLSALVLSVSLGIVSFYLFENPVRKKLRSWPNRTKTASAAT